MSPSSADASGPPPSSYCISCRRLFSPQGLGQASTEDGFLHSRVSRKAGFPRKQECILCAFLDAKIFKQDRIGWGNGADADEDGYVRFVTLGRWRTRAVNDDRAGAYSLECRFVARGQRARDITSRTWVLHPVADAESPAAEFICRRPPVAPYSQAAFDAANNWLSTCRKNHGECQHARNLKLPTRVLDIQPDGDTVKLYTPAASEEAQYACLSYCWGGDQEFILTQATLETFFNGVSTRLLGRTIQDAIEVTRRLGMLYLWVDALCIIQDSDQDKANELARMSSVYLNSAVTIAAADAVSSRSGFLQADGSNDQELTFEVPFQNGNVVFSSRRSSSETKGLEDYHLSTRAWTLQEMLLSPQILFYTRTELLWICEEDYMRQICPTRYDYDAFYSAHRFWRTILDKAKKGERFWDEWLSLVEIYTRRQMTFKHDRLRAIQALIEVIERISGLRCFHGMWEQSLPYTFVWYVLSTERSSKRLPLGAPTWSWASVNSPVRKFTTGTEESTSVRLFCVREDYALGLEAILIPNSGTHEHFPGTSVKVDRSYFPDLSNQPVATESFYMPIDCTHRGAVFLEVMGTGDDAFLRTGLLICYPGISDQLTNSISRFESRRIWLA